MDLESNDNVMKKIRIKLLDSNHPNMLLEEFEKVDEKSDGLLDSANFKTCLLKLRKQLELTIGEINRIARYEPKQKNGFIDYHKFLEKLDSQIISLTLKEANALNPDSTFRLKDIKEQVLDYISRHRLTPLKFLANLTGANSSQFTEQELKLQRLVVPLDRFKDFLLKQVLRAPGVRPETLEYYIQKVDIDRDGIVDGQDFEAFLAKHSLIEDTSLRLANTIMDVTGEDYSDKILKTHNLDRFYPVAPIQDSKIDLVLRTLRTAIASRNLSFREFFTKLDENKDGMVSFEEFAQGIKAVAGFSKATVKGLFAYMDRGQIGMVDFSSFLKVMKKSVLDSLEDKAEDNFDWQLDIIRQIQDWYFAAGITSEDAFRMMDLDYDQLVSKHDLKIFLESILFIPAEEITSVRIDRLFNLMDQYKRAKIAFEDFKRILSDDFRPTDNPSLTGGVRLNKHSFDWKLNARQMMGLYLSRRYKTLDSSFDEISHQGPRITFDNFNAWILSHSVLDGFNLTEKLLRDLFSDFDPHKKGHLTKADWRAVFGTRSSPSSLRQLLHQAQRDRRHGHLQLLRRERRLLLLRVVRLQQAGALRAGLRGGHGEPLPQALLAERQAADLAHDLQLGHRQQTELRPPLPPGGLLGHRLAHCVPLSNPAPPCRSRSPTSRRRRPSSRTSRTSSRCCGSTSRRATRASKTSSAKWTSPSAAE